VADAGVIFDFDGVLADTEVLWYRAALEILAEFGISVTEEQYAREWIAHGKGPEMAVVQYALPISAEEFRRRRAPVLERLMETESRPMPGAAAAVERLAARWPLAVATNSNAAWVLPLLERWGIRRYLRDVVTRERYARAKPEPDAFLAAAAALGADPVRCVVLEDAERGVVAAKAARCRCIAVPNSFTRVLDFSLADRVVPSLDSVTCDLVAELLSAS
jgi:HAD superfamily hydrolase (TIGR01509 family)